MMKKLINRVAFIHPLFQFQASRHASKQYLNFATCKRPANNLLCCFHRSSNTICYSNTIILFMCNLKTNSFSKLLTHPVVERRYYPKLIHTKQFCNFPCRT